MPDVPIIMYGALGSEPEKVQAFEQGADDYIVKGTGMSEVMARVSAAMRRSSETPSEPTGSYVDDVLNINYTSQTVAVCGAQIDLTRTKYKLLTTLVAQKDRPIPPDPLLHGVWGRGYNTDELVKWHIDLLRRKL
jgi:two-component system KDP operon response regulator KdpE